MKRTLTYFLISLAILSFAVGPFHTKTVRADITGSYPGKIGAVTTADGQGTKQAPAVSCGIDNLEACLAKVTYWFLTIASYFVGIAGLLLNYVVQDLVVQMGQKTGVLTAVTQTWVVFRDLANVALVFLMLLIGIATILRISTYGYKQLLWRVVVAALLVNFSLYFTKVVIDVTNVFATQIYTMILDVGAGNLPGEAEATACAKAPDQQGGVAANDAQQYARCYSGGFSAVFMSAIGINKFFSGTMTCSVDPLRDTAGYNPNDTAAQRAAEGTAAYQWNLVYISLLGTVFMLVIAFVFFAAAFMLIVRFLMFLFLMIISPIAFVGLIAGRGFGKTWWEKLLHYAIFAPAFFLLVWVAVYITIQMSQLWNPPTVTYACAALGNVTGGSLLIFFSVAIGMMIAALMLAQFLGMRGGAMVYNMGKGTAAMAAGFATAYTVGNVSRGASHVYNKARGWMDDKSENLSKGGKTARFLARTTQKAAAVASFGVLSDNVLNPALKSGYDAKFFGRGSLRERNKEDRERRTELTNETNITKASKIADKVSKNKDYELTPEEKRIMGSLSGRELQRAMTRDAGGDSYLNNKDVLDKLSDSQLKGIQENRESFFSEREKKSAEDWINRFENDLTRAVDSTDPNEANALIEKVFAKISPAKLAQMPGRLLVNDKVIAKMTKPQLDAIGRSGNLRENRAGYIRNKIESDPNHPQRNYWLNADSTVAKTWVDPYSQPNSDGIKIETDSVTLRKQRDAEAAARAAANAEAARAAAVAARAAAGGGQQQAQGQPAGGQANTPPPPNAPPQPDTPPNTPPAGNP